jgi:Fic family protein
MACVHYQLTAIRPFEDGNGRITRMVDLLLAREWRAGGRLYPVLSQYFYNRRHLYNDLLLAVSQRGEWEAWIRFYLEGIRECCHEALVVVERLEKLHERLVGLLSAERNAGRLQETVDCFFRRPANTTRQVEKHLQARDFKIAQRYLDKLERSGIIEEMTGHRRNRVYCATRILEELEK